MTLDTENQRVFLLELISKMSFQGAMLDLVVSVRDAIAAAPVQPNEVKE